MKALEKTSSHNSLRMFFLRSNLMWVSLTGVRTLIAYMGRTTGRQSITLSTASPSHNIDWFPESLYR